MLCWVLACGEVWCIPFVAGAASFCVQTHVGYLPLAAPLCAWGLVGLYLARRGHTQGVHAARTERSIRQAIALTVALVAFMWFPPLLDELSNSPGNLTALWHYFLTPPRAP